MEIELGEITQLCGTNLNKKRFIIDSIYKYFSGHRYTEYEKNFVENVKIDNSQIGRKYFDVIRIKSIDDLINELKISKTSAVMQWINFQLEKIEYKFELEKVEEALDGIYDNLNDVLVYNNIGIKFNYEIKSMLEILQKSYVMPEQGEFLETKTGYELLKIYLKLLLELQRLMPQQKLIILENIDHIVSIDEYNKVIQIIKGIIVNGNMRFILTTSLDGYVSVDKEILSGINVINDEIFSFPEYEYLYKFILDNYPCHYIPSDDEVLEKIRWSIQKIGNNIAKLDFKSEIYLKLINKTLGIESNGYQRINQMEISFICS